MDVYDKLKILTDAAKYDVACTSSGTDRTSPRDGIGSAMAAGCCHSFAGDGRCISLLKVLMSNACAYDCAYCVNRRTNDTPRATFEPRELAELTIAFYRRNYIEGLFLSSGVLKNPNYTVERMCEALRILREDYKFYGYIHAKAIPGADNVLLQRLGFLADRLSINIELPSQESLNALAPDKSKQAILKPMGFIKTGIEHNSMELVRYKHAQKFAPAGQSTQMIVGASGESDLHILHLTEGLYHSYRLKRVFFSAYIPVVEHSLLPARDVKPPLLREHRLYQADWLLRFYGFEASEILDEAHPSFNQYLDPKCNWAVNHPEYFPVEVNRAPYETLLRVPGVGVRSAKRILTARKVGTLDFLALKRLGVVLKRAQYFITCAGKPIDGFDTAQDALLRALVSEQARGRGEEALLERPEQLSLLSHPALGREELYKCLSGEL
ncbi:MAG: putative DNA modification/repair radical SAM protein [Clostridiaceae bacterium]|nr:putative DNA modification/repair radical SAM protein [Eubacteriales bacterium]